MIYRHWIVIAVLINMVFFFYCNQSNNSEQDWNKNIIEQQNNRIITFKKSLEKSKLNLNDYLGKNSLTNDHSLILYITSTDCFTCVESGLILLSEYIELYNSKLNIRIITDTLIDIEEILNIINIDSSLIYIDKRDEFRQKIKFTVSPIYLLIQNNRLIYKVYYPDFGDDDSYRGNFNSSIEQIIN